MNRRRLTLGVAALTLALTAACTGGDGGSDPAKKTQAPLTLADFKTSPDQPSAGFEPPADLTVNDPLWIDLGPTITTSLRQQMEASFSDPDVWTSTTDERTFALVLGATAPPALSGDAVTRRMYDAARNDDDRVGRLGYAVGSTFPADAQPRDSFIYKVAWKAAVTKSVLTVTAVAWGGYDTGGTQPVLMGRDFKLAGERLTESTVNYVVTEPTWAGSIDLCPAVVDGVLTPSTGRLSTANVDAYRAEFADPALHEVAKAIRTIAAADGGKVSDKRTREGMQKCLDETGTTS